MKTLKTDRFDLIDTIECGQTFSWIREGRGYINADIGQIVYVEQQGNTLYYEASSGSVDLRRHFRLNDPLFEIQEEIAKDRVMRESIDFAPGLRIVSDEFYPCLISFICSIYCNIPRLRGSMQSLRENYGTPIEFRGKTYHSFPNPEQLGQASEKDLMSLGLAWRADFIVKSTASILSGDLDPGALADGNYEDAHSKLRSLHGVGHKVADCVCLFSLGFLQAFPIDVWIERVIQEHFGILASAGNSYEKKADAAREYFGRYAGYAQEYLYYYIRNEGKKPERPNI